MYIYKQWALKQATSGPEIKTKSTDRPVDKHFSITIKQKRFSLWLGKVTFESFNFNMISGETKAEIMCLSLSMNLRIL